MAGQPLTTLDRLVTGPTQFLLRRTIKRWFETDATVFDTRRKIDRMIGITDPMPRGFTAEPAGMAGGGKLYRVADQRDTGPIRCVYYHGGGYIVGGLETHAAYCARLSKLIGGPVLFVDYRLAPEDLFPAAYDDACAAYRVAIADSKDMIVAGDSAGGGLALAVTQFAYHNCPVQPRKLILYSPWLDMTLTSPTLQANAASDSMLSARVLQRMRDAYLAGQDPKDPRASPIFGQLSDLPPTLVLVSESEVLRGDARRLSSEMAWKKGSITLHEYVGMPHIFPLLPTLPAAGRAQAQIAAFLAD